MYCRLCDESFEEPLRAKDNEIIDYGIGRVWATIGYIPLCPRCFSDEIYEEDLNEDDDAAEQDETVGVGLQQGAAVQNDG